MRIVQAGTMLLGTVAYLAIAALQGMPDQKAFGNVVLWTIIGFNSLLLIVTVLVVVDSIRKIRAKKTWELATGVFIVKFAAIPFFLINCYALVMIYLVGFLLFLFGGPVMQLAVTIAAGITYLAMLSTSIYVWASIVQLRREGRISTVLLVLYTIMLLVFVVDIVAGILLFTDARRGRNASKAALAAGLASRGTTAVSILTAP